MLIPHNNLNMEKVNELLDLISFKIKDFTGFDVKFLRRQSDEGLVFLTLIDKISLGLPNEFVKPLSSNIINNIERIIFNYFTKYGTFDKSLINNLIKDLSLSIIFEDYDISKQRNKNYEDFINDLKDIGARSYEGKPVDIGVVYCPNDSSLNQVKDLELDYIALSPKKSVKHFFNDEKPFLRLIDNMSLVIVVDDEFQVTAILRKKNSKESLNFILEKSFYTHIQSKIYNTAIDYFTDLINDQVKEIGLSFLRPIDELKSELKEKESIRPGFIYIALQNKKMDILTKVDFSLTYFNGSWKLKHYNFIRSILVHYLFEIHMDYLLIEPQKSPEIYQFLIKGAEVLATHLKRLSNSNTSSIIIIDPKNKDLNFDYTPKLDELSVSTLLKKNQSDSLYSKILIDYDSTNLNIKDTDYYLIESIASVDGALILDSKLNIVSFGEVINISKAPKYENTFGTGTTAAMYSSQKCICIKVSEDGDIYIFQNEALKLKI